MSDPIADFVWLGAEPTGTDGRLQILLLRAVGCCWPRAATCSSGAGRRGAAVLRASAVLLFPVEDGYDLGQCLVVADVAGEDDVGHADGLGCGIDGAEE